MFKKLSFIFAALGALLLTGCLEFEQQTLIYRYDTKTDTLRIFQVYRAIFGADKPDGLSGQELEQLQSVLSGQRTFFFSNWILEYDRDKESEALAELKKPEAQKEAKLDAAEIARQQNFLQLLLDNVRVENGDFYLDDKGKLCGVQRVTVTQFSKIVAAANGPIRVLAKEETRTRQDLSAEERSLYLKFSEQQQPCLVVEGNQLRLRLPITRAEYEKSLGPKADASKHLEEFKRAGGKLSFADNEMTWSIGLPSDQATTLTLPMAEKPYVPNAVSAVKSRAVIREKLDIAAAAKEFVNGTSQEKKPAKP